MFFIKLYSCLKGFHKSQYFLVFKRKTYNLYSNRKTCCTFCHLLEMMSYVIGILTLINLLILSANCDRHGPNSSAEDVPHKCVTSSKTSLLWGAMEIGLTSKSWHDYKVELVFSPILDELFFEFKDFANVYQIFMDSFFGGSFK